MIARPTVDQLAVRVCHAVRDVRGEHQAWIALDRVQDHLDGKARWQSTPPLRSPRRRAG